MCLNEVAKEEQITFNIDSSNVPMGRFKGAVNAFFDLLESVSKEIAKENGAVDWTISAEEGSARVIARSNNHSAAIVKEALPVGLRTLESGSAGDRPVYFSDASVKAARKLAKVCSSGANDIPIQVRAGREKTNLTQNTIDSVDEIVGSTHQAHGTIEGLLKVVTIGVTFVFEVHQKFS